MITVSIVNRDAVNKVVAFKTESFSSASALLHSYGCAYHDDWLSIEVKDEIGHGSFEFQSKAGSNHMNDSIKSGIQMLKEIKFSKVD